MLRGMPAPRARKFRVHSRETVAEFMAKAGLSGVGDLADKTGLSFKTVSLSINGADMTWPTLSKLAVALDVDPHAIADHAPDTDVQGVA